MASAPETRTELSSWKEIAEFLEVSVRTAQRYERELNLPVRRLAGEKGRAVVASVAELAEWKQRVAAVRWWQNPVFLKRYAVASTALILLLGVYVVRDAITRIRVGPPKSSVWLDSNLIVVDDRGREVWRRDFQEPPAAILDRYHADLNRDGSIESIVPHAPQSRETKGAILYCFSSHGEELWKINPVRAVNDAKATYSTVYVLRSYHVFPSPEKDGTRWVAATFAHHFAFPSVAIVVDGNGKTRGEYWHSGHLDRVDSHDLDRDGNPELLLAGMDLGSSRAAIRVFDPRNVAGASVLPENHPNQLRGFPPGTDVATVLFERGRLNKLLQSFNYATHVGPATAGDSSFQVYVTESIGAKGGYLIYTIRPDLTVSSISPSVSLQNEYAEHALKNPGSPPFGEADLKALRDGYVVQRRGSAASRH